MTKFERMGVEFQYRATTKMEAKRSLNKSCDICGKTGKQISCRHCAIANAHNDVMNIILVR